MHRTPLISHCSDCDIFEDRGKNGKYAWTRLTTNICSMASIHIQLFEHQYHNQHSALNTQDFPSLSCFAVIPPHQFLCVTGSVQTVSLVGGAQVRVGPSDKTVFNELLSHTLVIQTCMKDFVRKKGKAVDKEGEDTGGKGSLTLQVWCEFIVSSETICPHFTQQVHAGCFLKVPTNSPSKNAPGKV